MKRIEDILIPLFEEIPEITRDRMSVINGRLDFTEYGQWLLDNSEEFFITQFKEEKTGEVSDCIKKIIVAEIYYQKNDCYKALVMINSALAFLESPGNEEVWVAARYIQMCIMIVTGQLSAIYPMVLGMSDRVWKSNNKKLISNYEALRAWCALYDDDWDTIEKWMNNDAPNEFGKIELEDTFRLFIKARIYYMQGKFLSMISLLQSMRTVLERNARVMELCELYMLIALALDATNHKDEAYEYFDQCIEIARDRNFYRLLADEGETLYHFVKGYEKISKQNEENHKFIIDIRKMSKEMALLYPRYLRNHKFDYPKLTAKELDVLKLMADGRKNDEIAEFLGNSTNTVKYHIKNIFVKLEVKNRKQAVKIALEERLIK